MELLRDLETRLAALDAEIAEAERRLPAHSTKPATMRMLLELEDERDAVAVRINVLKEKTSG